MRKITVFFLILAVFGTNFTLFADYDEKLKLAVMEFEDKSGKLSEETISNATEYIRGAFVSTNKYVVIAKERQEKAMIAEMKKESYKLCNDKNCQIPLGQALSADTILRTTITFFAGTYTITSELIDLAKEATVIGAKQDYDGSETSLKHALNEIVKQITGATVQKESENEKLPVETYRHYKTAGISLLVAGAVVAAAGVATFHLLSEKEYDKYKNMAEHSSALDAVSEGVSYGEYIDKADKHRKKSNTYRILEITSGAVGGTLLVTGVVLTLIKKDKPDDGKIALSNFSVAPANDGFFATLGFEF